MSDYVLYNDKYGIIDSTNYQRGGYYSPAITTLKDGTYIVAYRYIYSGSSTSTIFYKHIDANGNDIGSNVDVVSVMNSNNGLQHNFQPEIIALKDGGFVITWSSYLSGTNIPITYKGIWAHQYDKNGVSVGNPFIVNSSPALDQVNPKICATSDGGYVISWGGTNGGSKTNSYFQKYDALGHKVGGETLIAESSLGHNAEITSINDGGFVAIYEHDYDNGKGVFLQIYDANCGKVGNELYLSGLSSSTSDGIKVRTLDDGSFIVITDNDSLHYRHFSASGIALNDAHSLTKSQDVQHVEDVIATPDGGFFVLWTDTSKDESNRDAYFKVFGQQFNASGMSISEKFILKQDKIYNSYVSAIDFKLGRMDNGNIVVTYANGYSIIQNIFSNTSEIIGTDQNDTLNGIMGKSNFFIGGAGADTFNGVNSYGSIYIDTVSYKNSNSGIYIVMGDEAHWTGDAAGDVLNGITSIVGTDYNDVIGGNANTYSLYGRAGDDLFLVSNNNKALFFGGDGFDTVSYANITSGTYTNPYFYINTEDYTEIEKVIGSNFNDLITCSFYSYVVDGAAGNDDIRGAQGDDTLIGGSGADKLNGGTGNNTASYETAQSGVYLVFGDAGHWTGDAAGDILINIQNLTGSAYNDVLLLDNNNNIINGGAGNDTIYGLGGDDLLIGGSGADILIGGTGNNTASYDTAKTGIYLVMGDGSHWTGDALGDTLIDIQNIVGSAYNDVILIDDNNNIINGGAGNDTIYGLGGDDLLIGGSGADILIGGTGNNTASYDTAKTGIYLVMGDGSHWTGDALGDTLIDIQNIVGSAYNDVILLDGNANILRGGGGNDTLYGMGGADTFDFSSYNEGRDTIMDFSSAEGDKIGIKTTGFNISDLTLGTNFFSGAGAVATTSNASFIFDSNTHILSYDADGNGAGAAIQIAVLNGVNALSVSDFSFHP